MEKRLLSNAIGCFRFNKAKRIVLVSYKNCEPTSPLVDSLTLAEAKAIDSRIIKRYELIIKDTVIRTSYETPASAYFVIEEEELDNESINQLSDIMCNYFCRIIGEDYSKNKEIKYRFTPHNSIMFFDEADNLIQTYDICFEYCQVAFVANYDLSSFLIDSGIQITQLSEIKKIFSKNGIVYGIN